MYEMKSLTLNGKKYDSFVDQTAREAIEEIEKNGTGGNDYVLTEADKQEIAELAAELVEVPEGTGLTDEEKTLMLTLFRNAAYTSANMGNTLTRLETLWGGNGGGEVEPDEPDVPVIPDEPEHTHSYTSSVTKAATCETAGVRTFTCSCGHSYTQSIPATGHYYVDGTCTNCGAADPDYNPDAPEKTLTNISATYNGGDVAVGTAVTDLTGIVVTAHYSDGSTETVTGYTLSGTIAEGSNTVTVSYGGKTTTFTVTGIAESTEPKEVKYNIADYATTIIENTSAYEALYYELGNTDAGGYGNQTGSTCYVLENIKAGDVIEFGYISISGMSATDSRGVLLYDAGGDLKPDTVPMSDFKKEMRDNYSWYVYKCTIANDHDKIYFWIGNSTKEQVLAYVPTLTRYE